jgi:hypothetical protein
MESVVGHSTCALSVFWEIIVCTLFCRSYHARKLWTLRAPVMGLKTLPTFIQNTRTSDEDAKKIIGVTQLLGNSGKTCHPWNVEFDEIHVTSFQEGQTSEDLESRTCEDLESRTCEAPRHWTVKIWNLKPAKPQSHELVKIWNFEPAKPRSHEPMKIWNLKPAKPRSREPAKIWNHELAKPQVASLWRYEVMNLWNSEIPWSPNPEVVACEVFHEWETHE